MAETTAIAAPLSAVGQFFRWIVYLLLGLLLFLFDPLGFDRVAESFSEELADLFVFGPAYGSGAQDDVSVVLINQRSLDLLDATWPISLERHAVILEALLRYKPGAVFVDILFIDKREDVGLHVFLDVVQAYKSEGIPLYFASIMQDGRHSIREDLLENLDLVALNRLEEGRLAKVYPLLHEDTGLPTPAFQLYQRLHEQQAAQMGATDIPIRVIWGTQAHPINAKWMSCAEVYQGVLDRFLAGIEDIENLRQTCPHAGLVPAEILPNTTYDPDIERLVQGNAVFLGASTAGVSDVVSTMNHGDVPGVFFHAMAYDNLVSTNGEYRRSAVPVAFLNDHVTRAQIDFSVMIVLVTLLTFFLRYVDRLGESAWHFFGMQLKRARLAEIVFMIAMALLVFGLQIFLAFAVNVASGNWLGLWALIAMLGILTRIRPAEKLVSFGSYLLGFSKRARAVMDVEGS